MASTIYELRGVTTDRDTLKVKDKVYDVPGVGGVAFELHPGGPALLILKHVAAVELEDAAISEAVRAAGPYDIEGRRGPTDGESREVRRRGEDEPRETT